MKEIYINSNELLAMIERLKGGIKKIPGRTQSDKAFRDGATACADEIAKAIKRIKRQK